MILDFISMFDQERAVLFLQFWLLRYRLVELLLGMIEGAPELVDFPFELLYQKGLFGDFAWLRVVVSFVSIVLELDLNKWKDTMWEFCISLSYF